MNTETELRYAQLTPLGDDQLFQVARNESAQHNYRVSAVELLLDRQSDKAYHPDLKGLRAELETTYTEELGVFPVPEADHETEITPVATDFGAPSASVTTATIFGTVQNLDPAQDPPADEAPDVEKQ